MLHFLAMNIENDIVIVKTGPAIVKHCHDTNLDKSNIPKISLICFHYLHWVMVVVLRWGWSGVEGSKAQSSIHERRARVKK